MKKILALVLAAMMLLACCSALAEDATPEGYPAVIEGLDLGGAKVYFYDYWTNTNWKDITPSTEEEQARYDYRLWLEKTYNCEIFQIMRGDWGTCAEEMINFKATPETDKLAIFVIEPGKVGSLMANNVGRPWKYVVDDEQWNKADKEFMTKGGEVYGLYPGKTEPRQVLFFNKRVLEEAGIDWNTIYDMQKDGTWTWAVFEDMLKTITRDTDNDGVNDKFGLVGDNNDFYNMAVFTNGGCYFDFDENGLLVPKMESNETMAGLTWGKETWATYSMPTPDGANWDWYKEAWKQGDCGFYMYQTYGGFNDNSEMADMKDEWGCVAFPVPEAGGNYITIGSDNMWMIPDCYTDEETVKKLELIFNEFMRATPGYDSDEDNWIGNKYNYTDERAVDETYAMLREDDHVVTNKALYLGTLNDVMGAPLLWSLGGSTPAELIEAAMPAWQAMCDTFNGK